MHDRFINISNYIYPELTLLIFSHSQLKKSIYATIIFMYDHFLLV